MKPLPKEVNKYVYIRSIPDTKYSIRLFPGSISAAEYCLDFVDSATGEPVNSPFEFELWAVENPETPWLSMPVTMQMRSIEYAHGIKQADILPGHEKFILRDGLTCVLIRPGKPKIQFTVPVRKLPDQAKAAPEDVVILAVAYELKPPAMGTWSRKGWVDGWRSLGYVHSIFLNFPRHAHLTNSKDKIPWME